jgi:hypothetical protein
LRPRRRPRQRSTRQRRSTEPGEPVHNRPGCGARSLALAGTSVGPRNALRVRRVDVRGPGARSWIRAPPSSSPWTGTDGSTRNQLGIGPASRARRAVRLGGLTGAVDEVREAGWTWLTRSVYDARRGRDTARSASAVLRRTSSHPLASNLANRFPSRTGPATLGRGSRATNDLIGEGMAPWPHTSFSTRLTMSTIG